MSSLVGGVGGAILGGAIIGGGASLIGGSMAASGAKDAAATQAGAADRATEASLQAQREQLAYLKEVDALPREYREKALAELGNTYLGPEGFQYPEGKMVDMAKNSEIYKAIMSGKEAGEESILRNQAATGGLRSGNTQQALYDSNVNLQNNALLTAYQQQQQQYEMGLQGVASLANLPLQTGNISNVMGNMGQTAAAGINAAGTAAAQGQVAAGQAWQQGIQGVGNAVGSAFGNYAMGKGMGWI